MYLAKYPLKTGQTRRVFEFTSEGPKGAVTKIIQFQQMDLPGFYNIAFGDRNPDGSFSDTVATGNGDAEKVLATVVASIYLFLELYPDAWIFATGNSTARTRLYQRGINKYYDEARETLELMGQTAEEWEEYEKGKQYEAVAVCRKKVYL